MKAREIMTKNPEVITGSDSVSRAAQMMRDGDYGAIPVVNDREGMRLQGVITDRDIAVRCVAEGHDGNCAVGDHMSRDNLQTARPDEDVDEVMSRMKSAQVRRVPVVENERIVGIIAQADLATEYRDDAAVEETVEKISEPSR